MNTDLSHFIRFTLFILATASLSGCLGNQTEALDSTGVQEPFIYQIPIGEGTWLLTFSSNDTASGRLQLLDNFTQPDWMPGVRGEPGSSCSLLSGENKAYVGLGFGADPDLEVTTTAGTTSVTAYGGLAVSGAGLAQTHWRIQNGSTIQYIAAVASPSPSENAAAFRLFSDVPLDFEVERVGESHCDRTPTTSTAGAGAYTYNIGATAQFEIPLATLNWFHWPPGAKGSYSIEVNDQVIHSSDEPASIYIAVASGEPAFIRGNYVNHFALDVSRRPSPEMHHLAIDAPVEWLPNVKGVLNYTL